MRDLDRIAELEQALEIAEKKIADTWDQAHEVSVLTSKLALANRALGESNQSITELHERIAQLEAALRDYDPT